MKVHHSDAEAFIFDLGNVIIDLDFAKWIKGFTDISRVNLDLRKLVSEPFFNEFEIGKLSGEEVCAFVNDLLKTRLTQNHFDKLWNGIMVHIPVRKLELLKELRQHKKVVILSNTNEIHQRHFEQWIMDLTGKSIYDLAHTVYYSHELGMRKPDKETYLEVINRENLDPSQTVFFDDNEDNINSSREIGLTGVLIDHPKDLFKYFHE